ncbi:MAG: hypothetical protein OXI60_10090 [Acidiferrobacterales bacterium]|nr:hypothetical protein [Acidiferrobacterales bacterium]
MPIRLLIDKKSVHQKRVSAWFLKNVLALETCSTNDAIAGTNSLQRNTESTPRGTVIAFVVDVLFRSPFLTALDEIKETTANTRARDSWRKSMTSSSTDYIHMYIRTNLA